jgi:predicted metal-dependent enzyme (double-stranded beta helix superfamily)
MSYTLDQLASECHDAMDKANGDIAGVEGIRQCIEKALKDQEFVATHLGDDNQEERKVLYEDPDYKFCILAHTYHGAKGSNPHDHADSWAIYGQAIGVTTMTDWEKVAAPSADEPGKVKKKQSYDLKPGMAKAYPPGFIHSPSRADSTKLIRVEGRNLAGSKRDKYVVAE